MNIKLISSTPDAEKIIAYCARVSSPNQDNPNIVGLLKYCWEHKHYSIFQMANLTLEITTSRAISHQILRHWAMYMHELDAQEHSQRYSDKVEFVPISPRRQDEKNRQNSIDDLDVYTKDWFQNEYDFITKYCKMIYKQGLERGIAKETMRFLLPECTQTRFYLSGNLRNWIFYILLREKSDTQLEHVEIVNEIKQIFTEQFPIISEAIWGK